jgi:hypothetical protein
VNSPEHRVDYPCVGITGIVEDSGVPDATYEDISLAEWLAHAPWRLVDEHLQVGEDFLNKISKTEIVLAPE